MLRMQKYAPIQNLILNNYEVGTIVCSILQVKKWQMKEVDFVPR